MLSLSTCTGRALRYPQGSYLLRTELSGMFSRVVRYEPKLSTGRFVLESSTSIDWHVKKLGGGGGYETRGGGPRSNPWVPYLPYLENPNFPIPARLPFCINITRNLLKLLFRMHMQFACVFFFFRGSLTAKRKKKKNRGNSPIVHTRDLYDTPLTNKHTHTKTQTKNGEREREKN